MPSSSKHNHIFVSEIHWDKFIWMTISVVMIISTITTCMKQLDFMIPEILSWIPINILTSIELSLVTGRYSMMGMIHLEQWVKAILHWQLLQAFSIAWMEEICTPGDNLKGKGEGLGKVTPKIPPNFSKCRGRDGETPRVVLNGTPRIRSPQIKPSPATSVQKGRQSVTHLYRNCFIFILAAHSSQKALCISQSTFVTV